MVPIHDRTIWHSGTEDATTTTLAAPIGRYAAGLTVQVVLEDMAARLAAIEAAGCSLIVNSFSVDAVIFGAPSHSFTLDAYLRNPALEFTIDAWVGTSPLRFTADAYLVDHVGGITTLAVTGTMGSTTITVTNPSGFSFSGSFQITIGGTIYTVISGGGTATWTLSSPLITTYPAGTLVTEVC